MHQVPSWSIATAINRPRQYTSRRRTRYTMLDAGLPLEATAIHLFAAWDCPPSSHDAMPDEGLQPHLLNIMQDALHNLEDAGVPWNTPPMVLGLSRVDEAPREVHRCFLAQLNGDDPRYAGSRGIIGSLVLCSTGAAVGWLGEIRADHLRKGKVTCVAREHTLSTEYEAIRAGPYPPDYSTVVTRTVGDWRFRQSTPNGDWVEVEPGDRLILYALNTVKPGPTLNAEASRHLADHGARPIEQLATELLHYANHEAPGIAHGLVVAERRTDEP